MALNVLGTPLLECSIDPVTGFYRDGCCNTGPEDSGLHLVCAQMNEDFLHFSRLAGNNLSTPVPQYGFPGLRAGDRWCLCVQRWIQAYESGVAPRLFLKATHISALEFVELDILKQFALDEEDT